MNNEDINQAIEDAEYEQAIAHQRFDAISKPYQEALANKIIAENRLLDLVLQKKNLRLKERAPSLLLGSFSLSAPSGEAR